MFFSKGMYLKASSSLSGKSTVVKRTFYIDLYRRNPSIYTKITLSKPATLSDTLVGILAI